MKNFMLNILINSIVGAFIGALVVGLLALLVAGQDGVINGVVLGFLVGAIGSLTIVAYVGEAYWWQGLVFRAGEKWQRRQREGEGTNGPKS